MKPSLHGVILGGGLSFEEQVKLASKVGLLGVDSGIEAIAALADRARGTLLHDERAQRVGFGLVDARLLETGKKLHRVQLGIAPGRRADTARLRWTGVAPLLRRSAQILSPSSLFLDP